MWIIRGILFLVVLAVLVILFLANSGQSVDLNLFGRQYLDLPLFWVLTLSFLFGLAVSFIFSAVRELQLQSRLRSLRNEIREHEREISELRSLPLRDYGEDDDEKEPDGE